MHDLWPAYVVMILFCLWMVSIVLSKMLYAHALHRINQHIATIERSRKRHLDIRAQVPMRRVNRLNQRLRHLRDFLSHFDDGYTLFYQVHKTERMYRHPLNVVYAHV